MVMDCRSRAMLTTILCVVFFAFGEAQGDPCTNSTSLSSVVEDSYRNHVDLIRQSVPMEVVKFYYELALKKVSAPECICTTFESDVDWNCVNDVFTNDKGLTSTKLVEIMSEDTLLPIMERLFPYTELREDLPGLKQLEEKAITEGREATLASLSAVTDTSWSGASFPSDALVRFDRDQDRACVEYAEKIDTNSLWLPSTALSAYVVGIAQQIFLLPGSTTAAETMLMEHVRIVYLAARCKRVTGDHLRVPAVFLEGFITRSHLALKNSSTGLRSAMVSSFPEIMDVQEIIRGSRRFFPEIVRRMSSLNSFGRAMHMSWNSTHVYNEDLKDVMRRNATLMEYNEYYSVKTTAEVGADTVLCGTGFRKNSRLLEISDDREYCCSTSCVLHSGSIVKRSIINEMCCDCCNERGCNVNDLAQVIQAQAFGFDRARESSVANVW